LITKTPFLIGSHGIAIDSCSEGQNPCGRLPAERAGVSGWELCVTLGQAHAGCGATKAPMSINSINGIHGLFILVFPRYFTLLTFSPAKSTAKIYDAWLNPSG